MPVRFAHMSDCHLGSWSSHPEMREKPLEAFEQAISVCIDERVDFIIIAGDLLDTSLPGVDVLKRAAAAFRRCKEAGMPVYMVAGSHDYSPTGKTMLSVFEEAGLITNVAKFDDDGEKVTLKCTKDEKTGVSLAGVFGRKGSLEVEMFQRLSVPETDGTKIFVFHCGIDEHVSLGNAVPVSLLPDGFQYYATGHIHIQRVYDIGGKKIAFPGPLFPTSFDELEKYSSGFYIVTLDGGITIDRKSVQMFDVVVVEKNVEGMSPQEVESALLGEVESRSVAGCVLLVKVHGVLSSGRPSDIDFRALQARAETLGALAVKKNISKLSSREMEEVAMDTGANIEDLEGKIIAEHADKIRLGGKDAVSLAAGLMNSLKDEKGEDETNTGFEDKIKANAKTLMGLGE